MALGDRRLVNFKIFRQYDAIAGPAFLMAEYSLRNHECAAADDWLSTVERSAESLSFTLLIEVVKSMFKHVFHEFRSLLV